MSTVLNLVEGVLNHRPSQVLATLVQVKGSSYRRAGARMLMDREGVRMGVISAGCMETDLAARVEGALAQGVPQVVKYDMGHELDRIWGTGMGCEGKADILLTPLSPGPHLDWAREVRRAQLERRTGVLFTVFASPDPAQMGLTRWWESPGDPAFSPAQEEAALQSLATGKPVTRTLDGACTLVEPVLPPIALWIYGAGENARPLATLAIQLGWDVGMLDHRPALARLERFPGARSVLSGTQEALAAALTTDARSAGVVMSHVFDPDKAMLRYMLESALPYVGLQGNRTRTSRLLKELLDEGLEEGAWRERLHAPMGLDLGADSPEIIALAVLAEIQAEVNGRPALPLREGKGSIHG